MSELFSLGELLIDFTPMGYTEDGLLTFARNPGGAPANVAVQAAKLGVSSGFIGKVGDDVFGRYLKETLEKNGISVKNLLLDEKFATTLAFVSLSETGDRSFSFYRNPGADTQLRFEEIDLSELDACKLLCYGSLLMTVEPSRTTVLRVAEYVKKAGKITAYDPNWRPLLWPDIETGVKMMRRGLEFADIVKVSEEELELISGEASLKSGAEYILSKGAVIVVATLGAKGCAVFTKEFSFSLPTYDTKIIDTTGSGDSFFGSFLSVIIKGGKRPREYGESELKAFADFANAAGAACATGKGAIPSMLDENGIRDCMKKTELLL